MRKYLTASAVCALLAAPVTASEGDGSFLDHLDATHIGDIAGSNLYAIDGVDMLWLALPGGHVMGGFIFDGDGRDVGADAIGAEAMNVYETLGLTVPDHLAAQVDTPASAPGQEADKAMAEALQAIRALPDDERRRELLELLLVMNDARTSDDLAAKISNWGQSVTGPAADDVTPPAIETSELFPQVGMAHIERKPDRDSTEARDASSTEVQDVADTAADLLAAMEGGFWISIGHPSARPVYMLLDPSCPHCAKAVANLQDDIESGAIELRILLAPVISERSISLVAGILQAENPAEALWEHEIEYARNGASRLKPGAFGELDADMSSAILANREVFLSFELPGVPFFAWSEGEEVKLLSGVPQSGHFTTEIAR